MEVFELGTLVNLLVVTFTLGSHFRKTCPLVLPACLLIYTWLTILNLPSAHHPEQTVAPGGQEWQSILSWSLPIPSALNVAGHMAPPEYRPLHLAGLLKDRNTHQIPFR